MCALEAITGIGRVLCRGSIALGNHRNRTGRMPRKQCSRQSPNKFSRMNESAMDEIIATTTTNSTEDHESTAAINEMLPTTNTHMHMPQVISCRRLYTFLARHSTPHHMPSNGILTWIMINILPSPNTIIFGQKRKRAATTRLWDP